MKSEAAELEYEKHRMAIEGNKRMANREVLGLALGVGAAKITAARRMLGVGDGSRKMFIAPLRDFFRKHQDFRIADAATPAARELFWSRHRELVKAE